MKNYGKMRSSARPLDVEFTADAVYVATNITPYEEHIDGRVVKGYEYDCTGYSKDEYLVLQDEKITSLAEQLEAAKILLGVE